MPTTVGITNIGRNIVQGRLKGGQAADTPGSAEPNQLGWGTGNATGAPIAFDRTQTALSAEAAEARVAATSALATTTTSNDTYTAEGTLTNNQGTVQKTITEMGLLDKAKAAAAVLPVGNLFMRAAFDGLPLDPNDSFVGRFRWQLT